MEIKDVFEFVTEYLMKTLLKNFLRKRTMLARHTMSTSLSTILNFKNVLKQKKNWTHYVQNSVTYYLQAKK